MNDRVAFSFHDKFRQYDLGEGHPFRGDRFVNAMQFFESQGLFDLPQILISRPRPASKAELLRVHDEDYIELIFRLAKKHRPYDFETPVSPSILEGTLLISGSAIECGEAVIEKKVDRAVSIGGGHHHAGKNYGGGFCIFNDIAVLVENLKVKHGVKRFLILDHDVHFGNGTSDIYYQDPDVLYISLHQDPRTIYPGTGFTWQTGDGNGKGFNVNVPLPPGTTDNTYLYALNEIFVPLAEEFKPHMIITNGGSDPHFADTLGDLGLTVEGFFRISRTIRHTADKVCGGQLVMIPGSGYNPEVLPSCWYALIAGMVGLKRVKIHDRQLPPDEPVHCREAVERTIDDLKRRLSKKWTCFNDSTISHTL